MELKIDLKMDYMLQIVSQIEELRSAGFKFDIKTKWIDLKRKYYKNQIEELEKTGSDIQTVKKLIEEGSLEYQWLDHQVVTFFSFRGRLISPQVRKIEYSKKFSIPNDPELKKGIKLLEEKIKSGESLFPHLSRKIFDATFPDGMLFDWGINHFHLGTRRDLRNKNLIMGRNEIIYGFVTEKIIYFLVVGVHGQWANKDILKIVKDDFPHLIASHKLKGILGLEHEITEKDQILLRAAGVNVVTELDGEFYSSPGGGITTARTNMVATEQWHFICRLLHSLEDYIQNEFLPKIVEEWGNEGLPEEIELNLNYDDSKMIVVSDKANTISIEAFFNQEKTNFEKFVWNLKKK